MQQGKRSQDVKSSFDATDDLEHVTSLSYTSHFPLNDRNAAQSTTSLHPQHSDDPSQTQAGREGEGPHRVYFDPHSQNQQNQQQHNPRSSSWDLLGGARKINEAYEHFDSRNASEQHLVFADGDLPNTKVSHDGTFPLVHMGLKTHDDQFVRFYQFLLSASIVTRWTLFIIPVLGIVWIPGIIGLTASPRGEVRFLFHSGFMVMWKKSISIFADMGSTFDMVEHMAKRRLGR